MFDAAAAPYGARHVMSPPISSTAREGNDSCSGDNGGQEASRPSLGPGSATVF